MAGYRKHLDRPVPYQAHPWLCHWHRLIAEGFLDPNCVTPSTLTQKLKLAV